MKLCSLITLGITLSLASCTSIKSEPVSAEFQVAKVCIQNNPKVLVTDFVDVLQANLQSHGISSTVCTDSVPADCEFLMTYTALRGWDFSPYLNHAEVTLEHKGERIGYAEYHLIGGGGLSLVKWESTEVKMTPVLDEMLAEYGPAQGD